jgi:serine/threonine-protein kinase
VDARTDLWAVGATLFTLVSGVLVHEGETAAQILVQVATRAARSLSSVAAQTPPEVVALVARALAFSREERFASAREMQIEVERVHLALYGVPPSRALLLPLAAGGPVLSAAATELSTPPRSGARSAPPVSAPRSLPPPSMTASVGMPLPSIDSALGRKALASGSSMAGTANPVAVHPSAAMAEPGRRTTRAFAGLVVVGFLAGAAWWWWWRPGMSAEDHTALAASGSPATQPVSTVAALPTAAVTATPEVSASAGLAAPPNVIPAASSPPSDNKGGPSHLHVHGGASQASPGSQFSPSGDKQHPLVPEPSSAEPRNPLDMQIH